MREHGQLGDLIARLDQAGAALRDIARVLVDYRSELVDAGFDRDEAMELVLDLQRGIMLSEPPQ